MSNLHEVISLPIISNINKKLNLLPKNSTIKTCDDYWLSCCKIFLYNEVEVNKYMLNLSFYAVFPNDFKPDSDHACFETFLQKYKIFIGDESLKFLFKYVPKNGKTPPSYSVTILSRVKRDPIYTPKIDFGRFWTEDISELFKMEMGHDGIALFLKECSYMENIPSEKDADTVTTIDFENNDPAKLVYHRVGVKQFAETKKSTKHKIKDNAKITSPPLIIENIEDYKSTLPEDLSVEDVEEYVMSHCNYYLENELNDNNNLLLTGFAIALPDNFKADSEHKLFKIFLKKFMKLSGDKSMRLLFEYCPPKGTDLHCYNVKVLCSIEKDPELDMKFKIIDLWSKRAEALFKRQMKFAGEAYMPVKYDIFSKEPISENDDEKLITKSSHEFHISF